MSAFTFQLKPGEFAQLCNMGEGWSVALAIHNLGPNRIKLRDAFADRETIEPGHMTIQVIENNARVYIVKEAPVALPTTVLVEPFPPFRS